MIRRVENRRLYSPFLTVEPHDVNKKKENFENKKREREIRKMRTYSERFTFSLRNDFHFSASILEASERRETGVNWTDKRYRLSDRPDRLAGDPHRARIRSGVLGTRLIRLARCGPSRSPNGTPCRQRGLSPIRNPDHDLCSMVEVTPR